VVEGVDLERLCGKYITEGSNPSLSERESKKQKKVKNIFAAMVELVDTQA
jgi:hypothetical protein